MREFISTPWVTSASPVVELLSVAFIVDNHVSSGYWVFASVGSAKYCKFTVQAYVAEASVLPVHVPVSTVQVISG